MNRLKAQLRRGVYSVSRTFELPERLYGLNRRLRGSYLRGVNYHQTPREEAGRLREHLAFFAERYQVLDDEGVRAFFAGEPSDDDRPSLVICFDDGQANNHEVAADLLDELGLPGWFFIVTSFVGTTKEWSPGHVEHFMDWDQVRDIDRRGHVIGSHTVAHPMLAGLEPGALEHEALGSKRELEHQLGHQVSSFCIPFGTASSFDAAAVQLLVQHYDYVFTSCPSFVSPRHGGHNLGRIPLEPSMSLDTVALMSSGLVDLARPWRRLRYERFLRGAR